jgi:hypothetical protein
LRGFDFREIVFDVHKVFIDEDGKEKLLVFVEVGVAEKGGGEVRRGSVEHEL